MFSSMSPLFLASLASLLSFLYILHSAAFRRKDGRKLPPGPMAWPIIGNLHMLMRNNPHRSLQRLAQKYGPIMCVWFGPVPTIVLSSPEAAEQFLKTHDLVFASRPFSELSNIFGNGKGMGVAPYGSYWRSARKLCTTQLLSTSKIQSFAASRREEMRSLVTALKAAGQAVDLSEQIGGVVEEMMHKMIVGYGKSDEFDLKDLIHKVLGLVGVFNISDFVPSLAPLDLQRLRRRAKRLNKQMDNVLEKIIREHEKKDKQHQTNERDFVDVLVSMLNTPLNPGDTNEVHIVDRWTIKAIILDMITGSIDTSATAIEWVMSELIRHPRVMQKLQQELQSTAAMNNLVEESDFGKLSYLDMVIKETLRLHAVVPLLIPRESMEDININGYHIPKKSRVMVNFWAIGRDRSIWSDNSEHFIPERFAGSNLDVKGVDFRMIPFGSGRRGCPGLQLGLTTTKLVVAQLVHFFDESGSAVPFFMSPLCPLVRGHRGDMRKGDSRFGLFFDWVLPDGMKPHQLDMTEKFGITMCRANRLVVKPTSRLPT